jgi:NADH:ubiquinone oxidoreductase subunit 4 (subunit M)
MMPMWALALPLFLLAGLCLPLFPLSIGVNRLIQRRATDADDRLATPIAKAAAMILLPLLGVGLVRLGLWLLGDGGAWLVMLFALWGGLTALLYAFRLLSARDGQIWIGQLYTSALALIWVGVAHGVPPLLPALGLAASLLPLWFLMDGLEQRFGTARTGLYPGLGLRMPRFSSLFVAAVLVAVAVPFSPGFFAIADLAFGGVGANELLTLVPLSLSWLLWTWAGINLLSGIVFGTPRDDLCYVDMDARATLLHGGGMAMLALFGLLLVEVML